MIIFRTLKYENFLSAGNKWVDIDYTKSKSTLVIGHNGAGKSSMLDALSFALFGKPHRNINKSQLVNSINKKDSLVEVVFTIGKSHFKVIRGINSEFLVNDFQSVTDLEDKPVASSNVSVNELPSVKSI